MHRSGADAEFLRYSQDACSGRQPLADTLDNCLAHRTATKPLPLCSGARNPGIDPASNHRSLELGECARYLEQQAACRRRGVDVLLIQVEIDPYRFQMLDRAEKVAERAPNPIYRPCHRDIESTPVSVLEQSIERR